MQIILTGCRPISGNGMSRYSELLSSELDWPGWEPPLKSIILCVTKVTKCGSSANEKGVNTKLII